MSLFGISRTDMRVAQTGFPAFPIARIVCSRYSQIMRVHLVRDLFIFVVTKFSNKVTFQFDISSKKDEIMFIDFANSCMSDIDIMYLLF